MSEPLLQMWTPAAVRCFAGYKGDERPTAFRLEHRDLRVVKILTAWREPDYFYFRVETSEGSIYELRHHEFEDQWHARESTG
jgi:hypothetical protein